MKPILRTPVATLLAGALSWGVAPDASSRRGPREDGPVRGRDVRPAPTDDWPEWLVVADDAVVLDLTRDHGGSWRASGLGVHVLRAPSSRGRRGWAARLAADARVEGTEPNYPALLPSCRQMSIDILEIVPRTGLLQQEVLQRLGSAEPLPAADAMVAIVDSGVAPLAEFAERLAPGIDVLAPGNGGQPRGRAVGRRGALPARSGQADPNGHGTAVASLIAALTTDARLLPVRVVEEDCEGTVFDLAVGIVRASEAGADVINVSLGTPHDSPVLARAVARAQELGSLVVAASGNGGELEYPAALPGVVAVTAVGRDDWPPSFAPLGPRIDLAAPGVDVEAQGPDGVWLRLSGTSPSAALVSAAGAAVVQRTPGAPLALRRFVLLQAVTPARTVHPALHGQIGSGILDLSPLAP